MTFLPRSRQTRARELGLERAGRRDSWIKREEVRPSSYGTVGSKPRGHSCCRGLHVWLGPRNRGSEAAGKAWGVCQGSPLTAQMTLLHPTGLRNSPAPEEHSGRGAPSRGLLREHPRALNAKLAASPQSQREKPGETLSFRPKVF